MKLLKTIGAVFLFTALLGCTPEVEIVYIQPETDPVDKQEENAIKAIAGAFTPLIGHDTLAIVLQGGGFASSFSLSDLSLSGPASRNEKGFL